MSVKYVSKIGTDDPCRIYRPENTAEAMVGFITRPQCALLHTFNDFQDFRNTSLHHHQIKLVLSCKPRAACQMIQKLSDEQEGTRRQVSVVQDIDKRGAVMAVLCNLAARNEQPH